VINTNGTQSLTDRTTKGMFWSTVERFVTQGSNLLIGIVLARILPPEAFGQIAMLTIFTSLASLFVDSGFGKALIQRKDKSTIDYSSVFYFNIGIGFISYLILFMTAPYIADFYKTPILSQLLRYTGLTVIINSFVVVHNAVLTEKLNFKLIAQINLAAVLISGCTAIWYAYEGRGVWALVIKNLLQYSLATILILCLAHWAPRLQFSFHSIKKLFRFGSKLLISGFIYIITGNLSSLLIGRFFHSAQLGYYTRGAQFSDTLSSTFQSIILNVSFPALATISSEHERFVSGARKMINMGALIICPVLLLFAALAKPFVILVLTDKWLPCVPIIQLLCLARAITSIGSTNLTMLQAIGRSDLSLKIDTLKIPLHLIAIFVGVFWGIIGVAIGQVCLSLICFYLNTYYTKKLFNYGAYEQLKDLKSIFLSLGVMFLTVGAISYLLHLVWLQLFVGALLGIAVYCGMLYWQKSQELQEIVRLSKKLIFGT